MDMPVQFPMMAIRTFESLPVGRFRGANEQRDEASLVLLVLLSTELADESEVELDECTTGTKSGSDARARFRALVTMFGNSHASGSNSSGISLLILTLFGLGLLSGAVTFLFATCLTQKSHVFVGCMPPTHHPNRTNVARIVATRRKRALHSFKKVRGPLVPT